MNAFTKTRLALFDLDNTLLTGDTDVLWCDFLIACGRLDSATFAAANAEMEQRYQAGQASAAEFCAFYVSLLKGITRSDGEVLRKNFFQECRPVIANPSLKMPPLDAGHLRAIAEVE